MRSMAELWGQRAWETGPQLATATGCLLMEERYVLHSKVLDLPTGSTLQWVRVAQDIMLDDHDGVAA